MSRLAFIWIVIVAMLTARSALAQSTIELRSAARIPADAAVRLKDIARLDGPEAISAGEVVIIPQGARERRITLGKVRQVLDSTGNINWGRVVLRGSQCNIGTPAPESKPVARPSVAETVLSETPDSVRRAVEDRICHIVQADAADLRLTFDASDAEILNLSTTGRTLEVKPTASSDRLPLALTLYEADRIIASKTIRVAVLIKKQVAVAAAPKARGDSISQADVTIDEQWIGPNRRPAKPEMVIGAAAQGRIATGQIISESDIAPPIIVSKGDQIMVSCVSGTIVLTTKARAMSSGRVGEVIQFQGLEDKRTFSARMSGRGRAVVVVPNTLSGHHAEIMP